MADFAGSRLKIERARKHIEALGQLSQEFLQLRPYELITRLDPETGILSIGCRAAIDPPAELSLVAGDAIHNLRAALDHAIFSVLLPLGAKETNIQFPFYTDEKNKILQFNKYNISLAGEKFSKAIEYLEPFPAGKFLLYEIHKADIVDKHKLLIPIGRSAPIPANTLYLIEHTLQDRITGPGVLLFTNESGNFIDVQLPPDDPRLRAPAFEVRTAFQPKFSLHFSNASNLPVHPIAQALSVLADNVSAAIDILEVASGESRSN